MGKKIINEDTTVVDLRKKTSSPKLEVIKKPLALSDSNEPTVVVETKQSRSIFEQIKKWPKTTFHFTKKTTILLIILMVMALIASGYGIQNQRNHAKLDCTKKTCQEILKQAARGFIYNNIPEQKRTAEKIIAIKHYDQQPNYMLVLTIYYINISNYDKAKKSLNGLSRVYDAETGYSQVFQDTSIARSPSELSETIDALKQNQTKSKANYFGVNAQGNVVQGTQ